ncbi:protein with a bacterial immunoglobulin-like domain protein [Legionella santicrucis]|uniref:Protein with a bacterial immunoglobulin-like domain protein n=1 Tax=Legionella santicrucis TaxID=45074 RepID=A0A0W0ZEB8_9GAMM|nr:Ig-like domain-containing protein [Legionella santicrucis]KTD67477.1 protein with a bacterial immunoglobulin-like domain protein [Legionella santicrucis]
MFLKKIVGYSAAKLLFGFILLFSAAFSLAGTQPKFDIIPTTATTKQVLVHGYDTVQYRVTNNTKITRTLVMKTIPGITQIEAAGCANPFTLSPGASCFLTLALDGSLLPKRVVKGPEICKTKGPGNNTPDPFLCSQPSAANSLNITVTSASVTLTQLVISPPAPSIAVSTTQKFTATGVFSDGSIRNLTPFATWSSSNTAVATISNNLGSKGLATAATAGVTTISATVNGVSANTTLTVTGATLSSISVTPVNASIGRNTSLQYTATGIFSDGTNQDITQSVTWTTGNSGIATISNSEGSKGLATGVGAGTTTVTAALGAISNSTNLTVTLATLVSIQVDPANSTMLNHTSQQFYATGIFSNGTTQDLTQMVSWTSSSNAVSISNDPSSKGLGQAEAIGEATITARLGLVAGSTSVTVTAATLTSIHVQPVNSSIVNGTGIQFTATAILSNGVIYDVTKLVLWSSTDESIAKISNDTNTKGFATGTGVGTTTITASLLGVSGDTSITVTAATLSSISVTPVNASIGRNTNLQYTATGIFSDGTSQDITQSVTWTTGNSGIAAISNSEGSKGLATGVGAGTTTVTAALGAISNSTNLTVTLATLVSIEVDPANSTMLNHTSQQFYATGIFSNGTTQDLTQMVSWTSSSNAVFISNDPSSKGLGQAESIGAATITARLGLVAGSTSVTVTTATLASIQVLPVNPSIANGTGIQFTARAMLTNGTIYDVTKLVLWSSANENIAKISNDTDSKGFATGTGVGTTTITASLLGVSGNTSITVTAATLTQITIAPATTSVPNSATEQYLATGTFSNGTQQNITKLVIWSSSNTAIATISNTVESKGLAQAAATGTGTTTITAAFNGLTSNLATLDVVSPVLTQIRVEPENYTTIQDWWIQYQAIAIFSDSSTFNITTLVTWNSSDTAVASISNATGSKGRATTEQQGVTTISASYGGITGSASLTVYDVAIAYFYIPNDSGSVSICPVQNDGFLGACYDSLGVFNNPRKVALNFTGTANPSFAYVTNSSTNNLSLCTIQPIFSGPPLLNNCTAFNNALFNQPTGIHIDYNSSFLYTYIVNKGNNTITVCESNSITGALSNCVDSGASGVPLNSPSDVAVSRNNYSSGLDFVYVSNSGSNNILACPIQANGTLGACVDMGNPGPAFNNPTGINLTPGGDHLYISNFNNNMEIICWIDYASGSSFYSCDNARGGPFSGPTGVVASYYEKTYIVNQTGNSLSVCTSENNGLLTNCLDSQNSGVPFNSPQYITAGNGKHP